MGNNRHSEKKSNNTFLLVFFGMIILIQVVGIVARNFQVNGGQMVGIAIGLIGYGMIMASYIKEKKGKKK
jgi:ABC-type arginine transport system permease subunit